MKLLSVVNVLMVKTIDGEVVLTSINRAEIFSAYFNLEYPVKENL